MTNFKEGFKASETDIGSLYGGVQGASETDIGSPFVKKLK
jgi:hypothetical protein